MEVIPMNEIELYIQNNKMLLKMELFLQKASGCFKALQQLDASPMLETHPLLFAIRLFEKARYNLCQANYSAEYLFKHLREADGFSAEYKLKRRYQEFERGEAEGKTNLINKCLRSIQYSKYGNKVHENNTAYE
jgi:hypothetical protein